MTNPKYLLEVSGFLGIAVTMVIGYTLMLELNPAGIVNTDVIGRLMYTNAHVHLGMWSLLVLFYSIFLDKAFTSRQLEFSILAVIGQWAPPFNGFVLITLRADTSTAIFQTVTTAFTVIVSFIFIIGLLRNWSADA
ncbi:hypothetical protein [Natrialbaceae archaeon AArc-T1-2]|uniref:hypothetical protein n=1 Tax=Natrialbaceae archaeon AArc-T1-2 TaxID=3053904 RepID=UPI00255AEA8C|nr:hypothetical protein [Natrialbaceae archaeon AArc-T1-2]WIV66411.1 hypothetical protein QQ977_12020 [Natrialbaceae archaeon AArc-T1-2]